MSMHGTKLLFTLKMFTSGMYLGCLKGTGCVLHSLYLNLNKLHCVWRKYCHMMQSSGFEPEGRAPLG